MWKLQNPIQNPNRTKHLTMGLKFYIIVNIMEKFYIIVNIMDHQIRSKHQTNTNPKENICQNPKIKICMMERYQRTMNQVLRNLTNGKNPKGTPPAAPILSCKVNLDCLLNFYMPEFVCLLNKCYPVISHRFSAKS